MINIPENIYNLLQTFSFRGNKNLRPKGSVIEYSAEMLTEYIKCKQDPIYFIKKYIKIIHVDRGVVPFELFPYQEKMIRSYHENRKCISLLFRQAGKTTTTAAYITWFIIFNDEKTCLVLANKAALAREILHRVKSGFENLPLWMQQGVISWNKGSIELENGSRVIAAATSSGAGRGYSISLLYLDEFAHLDAGVADDFFTSVYPTISSGKDTKIIISSTPNGFNLFQKFWVEAEKGINGFYHQRFDWWEHPERSQEWADEQRAVLGELKYNQEILMTFLGSSRTLLNNETLARLTHVLPISEPSGHLKGLKIYKNVEHGHSYVMTVDTSRGRHLDSSAFTVFDISKYPHTIACTYRNNEISPLMYAQICEKVAKEYNMAYMLVEINDVGSQVAETIFMDLEYEGEMFWTKGEQLGKSGGNPYPGIRTTVKTKRIGCANLKDMIENNQVIVNDFVMISELSTFIQKDNGKYEADDGFHDDTVTTLWLHSWLCAQSWFGDLTDTNFRLKLHAEHIREMEDSLMPPTIMDGTEEYLDEGTVREGWF